MGPRYPVFPGAEYLEEAQEWGLAVEKGGGVLQGGLERGLPQAWHPMWTGWVWWTQPLSDCRKRDSSSRPASCAPNSGGLVQRRAARLLDEAGPAPGGGPVPTSGGGVGSSRGGCRGLGGSGCWPPKRDETEGPLTAGVGKKEVNSRSF